VNVSLGHAPRIHGDILPGLLLRVENLLLLLAHQRVQVGQNARRCGVVGRAGVLAHPMKGRPDLCRSLALSSLLHWTVDQALQVWHESGAVLVLLLQNRSALAVEQDEFIGRHVVDDLLADIGDLVQFVGNDYCRQVRHGPILRSRHTGRPALGFIVCMASFSHRSCGQTQLPDTLRWFPTALVSPSVPTREASYRSNPSLRPTTSSTSLIE